MRTEFIFMKIYLLRQALKLNYFRNYKDQRLILYIKLTKGMAEDCHKLLLNKMAYGSISRGDLPGDLQAYEAVLVKQYHSNSPPTLKLRFKSKNPYSPQFSICIDDVRDPATPLILIKYVEKTVQKSVKGKTQYQNVVTARPANKIRKKMILNVQKYINKNRQAELEQDDNQSLDSDIPRENPVFKRLQMDVPVRTQPDNSAKPRKKPKGEYSSSESEQSLKNQEEDD